jgi:RecJ-like exonuclease
LHPANPSKFEVIFGSDMRLLLAILGLLLCLVASRADKPIVIKDSEAIKYVGKEVEVRGRVVSVTTSPLGTAFINFGGQYLNQTFAGFIAAGSKIAPDQQIATLQGKIISITGTIELYRGKPEIKVMSPNQIQVLGSRLVKWRLERFD